jgi:ubiquitin C-terminal hydrolase
MVGSGTSPQFHRRHGNDDDDDESANCGQPNSFEPRERRPQHLSTSSKRGEDSPAVASASASPPSLDLFSTRKRRPERVEFVYPKSESGESKPYAFGKTKKEEDEEREERKPRDVLEAPDSRRPTYSRKASPVSSETLDDILFKRKKLAGAEVTIPNQSASSTTSTRSPPSPSVGAVAPEKEKPENEEDEMTAGRHPSDDVLSSPGHLSGWSVERAVRDAAGCRPRANSTDGELNLPQRGLCDERAVLESYRWKLSGGVAPPRGFLNLGNTCFLNSTLQCLLYLPPFSQCLLSLSSAAAPTASEQHGVRNDTPPNGHSVNGNKNGGKPNLGKRITHLLRNLFHQVLSGGGGEQAVRHAIAPQGIVRAIPTLGSCGSLNGYKFRLGRQEDAHEFLVHLLDAMNDGELREAGINQHASGWRDRLPIPRLDETTFVHRIFGGYLRSQVQCVECRYRSNTYDPFLNLSLEVAGRNCSSLADAISEFSRAETLDKNNRWKCSGCEKKVCATKQLTVFRPPLALCMQLKRFTYGGMGFGLSGGFSKGFLVSGVGGKKITKPIDFPAKMNLPLSDGRSCAYSLMGLVIHVGGSASSGHYTAYVKRPNNHGQDQWYEVDDSFVQAVSERTVLQQKDAYLLFYCRQEVKLAFPTPPLRSSMTADQAKELGRSRARARAESMDQRISDSSAPVDSPVAARLPGPMADCLGIKLAEPSPVEKVSTDVNQSTPTACQDGTVPEAARNLSTASEGGPVLQEHLKAHGGSPNRASLPSHNLHSDDNKEETSSSGSASSSSTSSSGSSVTSSSSDATTSSDSSRNENGASAAMNQAQRTPGSVVPIATSNAMRLPDSMRKAERRPATQSDNTARGKTRIVVDRGSGRGKLEVMLGPRYRKAKAWKPDSSNSSRGAGFGLLGNRQVGHWDEDALTIPYGSPSTVSGTRADLERTEASKEKARKRKVFLDRWDSHLDQGKVSYVGCSLALISAVRPGLT